MASEVPFSVPLSEFALYVRREAVFPAEDVDRAERALASATEDCVSHLGESGMLKCPESTLTQAILDVAADLFARREAVSGFRQIAEGESVRVYADPMRLAYPLLDRYKGLKTR